MHHKNRCFYAGFRALMWIFGLVCISKAKATELHLENRISGQVSSNTAQVSSKGSQVCKPFDKPNECLHFLSKLQTIGWHLAMEFFSDFLSLPPLHHSSLPPLLAKIQSVLWNRTFKMGILIFFDKHMSRHNKQISTCKQNIKLHL